MKASVICVYWLWVPYESIMSYWKQMFWLPLKRMYLGAFFFPPWFHWTVGSLAERTKLKVCVEKQITFAAPSLCLPINWHVSQILACLGASCFTMPKHLLQTFQTAMHRVQVLIVQHQNRTASWYSSLDSLKCAVKLPPFRKFVWASKSDFAF